jgi:hypothetical protein
MGCTSSHSADIVDPANMLGDAMNDALAEMQRSQRIAALRTSISAMIKQIQAGTIPADKQADALRELSNNANEALRLLRESYTACETGEMRMNACKTISTDGEIDVSLRQLAAQKVALQQVIATIEQLASGLQAAATSLNAGQAQAQTPA